ncbi:restriction endonuclease [Clostridium botulinum]|nr:restriction endonuclease [Clostridium botulinum]
MYFILFFILIFIAVCWICSKLIIRGIEKDFNNKEKYNKKAQMKLISKTIDKLDGNQFEQFCVKLLTMNNYKAEQTKATRDGGKDIILKTKKEKIFIECKHYAENNKINTTHIHKLISACTVDNVRHGIFITTSNYTADAIELANDSKLVKIDLLYKDDLLHLCNNIDRNRLLEWLGYDESYIKGVCRA